MIHRISSTAVLLAALLIGFTGCVSTQNVEVLGPQEAFEQGMNFYERQRYLRAIEYFQRVFDFGRAHEWAADAQYYLAQSYYNSRQYLLAANSFTRFVGFYPQDPRVEEGEFMRALSYVRLSPPYQLDQTDTRNALEHLNQYVSRFPDGEYVDRALGYVEELRYKLARKQFEIAEQYERRSQYQAAALEYLRVIESHPDSEFADASLLGAMRSYQSFAERSVPARRVERYRLALQQYDRFLQLFPQSPLVPEVERLHADIQAAIARYDATASG